MNGVLSGVEWYFTVIVFVLYLFCHIFEPALLTVQRNHSRKLRIVVLRVTREEMLMRKEIKSNLKFCLFVLLTAVTVIAMAPFVSFSGLTLEASAEEITDSGIIYYISSEGNAEVSGYEESISSVITVPEEVNGYPVTAIGYGAFQDCPALTEITLPDSITLINEDAFRGCTALTSIAIPDSVTFIGGCAFCDCTSLESITLPDSVAYIDVGAFFGCTSLESITLPDCITYISVEMFYGCTALTSITIPDSVTSVYFEAFYGCTALTDIIIPDSVTYIGSDAFYDTAYYNNEANWENGILYIGNHLIDVKDTVAGNITLKNGIKTIPAGAFYQCASLTGITIPNSVTRIDHSAFDGCTSLSSITIPDSVTSIDDYTFRGCTSLSNIIVPDSVMDICSSAFAECTSLKSINIPDSVTDIYYGAFADCTSLASITIPDSVTYIDSDAFYNTAYYNNEANWENGILYIGNHLIDIKDTVAGSITLKNGIKRIPSGAFYDCTSLAGITIPDSVTSIGDSAFAGCTSLTSINIPDSVTMIYDSAFEGCTSLTSINIPDSVTDIGYFAFEGCTSLTSITIPDSVTYIDSDAFYNTAYYNNEANWKNGVLYINNHLIAVKEVKGDYVVREGTRTIASFTGCREMTGITIPDTVTSLQYYAFQGCTSLEKIELPDTLINVYSNAFEDTAYYNNEENYENNVLYIGKYLIGANDNVNGDITVKDGTKVIANNALRGMHKVKSVKLPDTLEYIGISAFYSCDLTEVVLPESVSFVGFSAFCGCESLKKITILNPQAELDDFTVGGGWPDGFIKAVIHGYDGSTAEAYAKEHNMEFVSLGAYDVKNNITETETVKTVGENSIFAVSENTVEGLLNNIKADVVIKDKDGKDVKNTDILKSGMTVTFTDKDGKAIETLTVIVPGDNDGDGAVSSADARSALRAAVGLDKMNDWQMSASDVEEMDKKEISSADARYILRAAVGLASFKDWIKRVK